MNSTIVPKQLFEKGFVPMTKEDIRQKVREAKLKAAADKGAVLGTTTYYVEKTGKLRDLFPAAGGKEFVHRNRSDNTFKAYHLVGGESKGYGDTSSAFITGVKVLNHRNTLPFAVGWSIPATKDKSTVGDGSMHSHITPSVTIATTPVGKELNTYHPGKHSAFAKCSNIKMEHLDVKGLFKQDKVGGYTIIPSRRHPVSVLVAAYGSKPEHGIDRSRIHEEKKTGFLSVPTQYINTALALFQKDKKDNIPEYNLGKDQFPIRCRALGDIKSADPERLYTVGMTLEIGYQLNDTKAAAVHQEYLRKHA